jgi:manganese transport protein
LKELQQAIRFNFFDSMLALNAALLVNAAILVMAAAAFFKRGVMVTEIQQAHSLLSPILGTTMASVLFGAALLCSGQSSTLTGTMAGQVVMEGFLRFKMQPWLRRIITRLLAITPAVLTIWFAGEQGTYKLLILSQVVLSIQLPFAVIPLVQLTGDRSRMGEFASGPWLKFFSWLIAACIFALNAYLAFQVVTSSIDGTGKWARLAGLAAGLLIITLLAILTVLMAWPLIRRTRRKAAEPVAVAVEVTQEDAQVIPRYDSILVPLDHSPSDHQALANAVTIAKANSARVILLHIEEGVTSRMFGALASTAEVEEGEHYLDHAAAVLRNQGIEVDVVVRHGSSPAYEIAEAAKQLQPDLLIMAAHGHRGLKDLVFGSTINNVRHRLRIPVLIVQGSKRQAAT